MLRSFSCTGFKSFDGFTIDFSPGLNVIVGPNGSGKTNIFLFLEFIGKLSERPLMEAIGEVGGAGSIFRRTNDGRLGNLIEFTISGSGEMPDYRSKTKLFVKYEYSAEIILSLTENAVFFRRQRVKLSAGPVNDLFVKSSSVGDDCDIESVVTEDAGVKVLIHKLNDEIVRDIYFREPVEPEKMRERISSMVSDLAKTISLYEFIGRFVAGAAIIEHDLAGAQSYNISPSQVRAPEDIASRPFMQSDGKGLAATLYALQSHRTQTIPTPYFHPFLHHRQFDDAEKTFLSIISHSRLVNDSVWDISVEPDPIESKLRIFLEIGSGEDNLRLPFGFVSDGTAKWFAVVTAVMTGQRLFALEEPENFLHPAMQAEIVRMVRNQFESLEQDRFAVLTTHSETILDNTRPTEVIIVNFADGCSIAKRVSDPDLIDEEIRNTGFGLGYYYLAGAVS